VGSSATKLGKKLAGLAPNKAGSGLVHPTKPASGQFLWIPGQVLDSSATFLALGRCHMTHARPLSGAPGIRPPFSVLCE
jgi:hypothetical protein